MSRPSQKYPSWNDLAATLIAAGAVALPRGGTAHVRYRMPDGRVFSLTDRGSRDASPGVRSNLKRFLSESTRTPLRAGRGEVSVRTSLGTPHLAKAHGETP